MLKTPRCPCECMYSLFFSSQESMNREMQSDTRMLHTETLPHIKAEGSHSKTCFAATATPISCVFL